MQCIYLDNFTQITAYCVESLYELFISTFKVIMKSKLTINAPFFNGMLQCLL